VEEKLADGMLDHVDLEHGLEVVREAVAHKKVVEWRGVLYRQQRLQRSQRKGPASKNTAHSQRSPRSRPESASGMGAEGLRECKQAPRRTCAVLPHLSAGLSFIYKTKFSDDPQFAIREHWHCRAVQPWHTHSTCRNRHAACMSVALPLSDIACHGCQALPAPKAAPFQKCSGCRRVRYCSPQCQLDHWKQHKKQCKKHRAEQDCTDAQAGFADRTAPLAATAAQDGSKLQAASVAFCPSPRHHGTPAAFHPPPAAWAHRLSWRPLRQIHEKLCHARTQFSPDIAAVKEQIACVMWAIDEMVRALGWRCTPAIAIWALLAVRPT
jgi:hypothetical protein